MTPVFRNWNNNAAFDTIIEQLSPFAPLLDNLCHERKILALVAIGSRPAGYAHDGSDLDIFAFVEDVVIPQRMHFLGDRKICLRETSFKSAINELQSCPDVSLIPMTLLILPYAVIYVKGGDNSEFWQALRALQARALRFILNRLAGEIDFGVRTSRVEEASIAVTCESIAGYHIMFSQICNYEFARKLPRMRANFTQQKESILRPENLPKDWSISKECLCYQAPNPGNSISHSRFVLEALRTTCRWHHPLGYVRAITFKQRWRHVISNTRRSSDPVATHPVPLWYLPVLQVSTFWAAWRPEVRQKYGHLVETAKGWGYAGLGSLFVGTQRVKSDAV